MITEEQRLKRNKGLGASDIPIIFGLSSFKTPADLWLEKTGRVVPQEAGEQAEIGNALEAGVKPLAEKRLGVKLVKPTGTFVADNGIMFANVDLMVDKAQRGSDICEIKTTGAVSEWEDGATPDRVLLQVAAQMVCARSSVAHIAVLLAKFGLQFQTRTIELAQVADLAAVIEEQACEWWAKHIQADTCPEGIISPDYLSKRNRSQGLVIPVREDLIHVYNAAKEAAKRAESVAEAAKSQLIAALGDAEIGEASGWQVKFTEVSTKRIDGDALRNAYPEIAQQVTRDSSYRRLTIKEVKK